MQERSRKLRLALLAATFGVAAGMAAAQIAGTATPTARTTTTARATVTTPTRSFLGTRSGPTSLGTSASGSGTITPIAPPGGSSNATVTASGTTAARTDGGLECPTLAGIAAFAGCEGNLSSRPPQ